MYMSYQMMKAIEDDRLRSLEAAWLRQEAVRYRKSARRDRARRRAIIRIFRPGLAAGQTR